MGRCASLTSKHSQRRGGIGLYSYEQEKYVTPFQYLAQIAVGAFIFGMGTLLLYRVASDRTEEIRKYGAANSHFWGWLGGCVILVIGAFMAHAGVIFYSQKIGGAFRGFCRGRGSSVKK